MSARELAVTLSLLSLLAACRGGSARPALELPDPDYARVLRIAVRDGGVDYAALRRDPAPLRRCLRRLEAGRPPEDARARKGYLIDAYNACILRLLVDHPEAESIRALPGLGTDVFQRPTCALAGERRSLDAVERELRDEGDARIHMALVCGSRGCPDLEAIPWSIPDLERRLDAASRRFLEQPGHARVRDGRIELSQLFAPDWLGPDFVRSAGSVEAWLRRHGPLSIREALDAGMAIVFVPYDWSINGLPGPR